MGNKNIFDAVRRMRAEGYPHKQIAEILGISVKTSQRYGHTAYVTPTFKVTKKGPEGYAAADRYIRAHSATPGFYEAFLESRQ